MSRQSEGRQRDPFDRVGVFNAQRRRWATFACFPKPLIVFAKERILKNAKRKLVFAFLWAAGAFQLSGCGQSSPVEYRLNSVELLKQERLFLSQGEHFDDRYKTEIGSILTAIFGTPGQPVVPMLLGDDDPISEVLSVDKILRSAGPVRLGQQSSGGGLFRRHCSHCHGITGDGNGPTAAFLNPYPRDFRLGKFKYKSTPLRAVPTDNDLREVLIEGVPGSPMPSFRTLADDEIEALVDYVKFLSMRGQYERYLMAELSNLDPGEPLLDIERGKQFEQRSAIQKPGQPQSQPVGELEEDYLDSMFERVGELLLEDVVSRWVDAEDNVSKVPDAPAAFSRQDDGHRDFLRVGRELFHRKGNCAQCHGNTGAGNGQVQSFDDWTNDWIKTPGVNPFNPQTYRDFTDAGALTPRPIRPRNLTQAVYRGGGRPEEIYLRIANGIEGTPMPAAPALTPEEIWALVAFVKFLPYNDLNELPLLPVDGIATP